MISCSLLGENLANQFYSTAVGSNAPEAILVAAKNENEKNATTLATLFRDGH